ncbi:MAG: phosphatase PAP2 family protein [Bacillota bacterium]
MQDLLLSGIPLIQRLQSIQSPLLDAFFVNVTRFGNESFFLLWIPIIYWCIDKRFAFRLGVVFLFSNWLNVVLKNGFATTRPSPDVVRVLYAESGGGYAFPSGHTQAVAAFWTFVARNLGRAWLWVIAAVIMVLVGISRMYLGLHYPLDVLGGLVLGVLCVVALDRPAVFRALQQGRLWPAFWPLVLLVLDKSPDAAKTVGFAVGLLFGYGLEEATLGFVEKATLPKQLVKVAVGVALFLGAQTGLKYVFGSGMVFGVLRYMIAGVAATYVAPLIFTKVNLAARGQDVGA